MMESDPDYGSEGNKRKKPEQEPLAYAFRGSRGAHKESLGNEYGMVAQMNRVPNRTPRNNRQVSMNKNNNSNRSQKQQQYSQPPPPRQPHPNANNQYSGGSTNHQMAPRRPFGMPAVRMKRPRH